jgi:hypothetical protein
MITADKTMVIEKANIIPSNWSENSGTVGDGESAGFGLDEEDAVGVGVGVGVRVGVEVGDGKVAWAVIVPVPLIVAVVEAEFALTNVIDPVSDDHEENE